MPPAKESPGIARRLLRAFRPLQTRAVEGWLRIDTVSMPSTDLSYASQVLGGTRKVKVPLSEGEVAKFQDGKHYETVPYGLFRRFLRPLRAGPDDVVFDIGCGLGRFLCVFARMGVKRCVGVELSSKLAEVAKRNVAALRGRRAEVEVRCGDASVADYAGGTIYVMFNPFGAETLRAVLEQIRRSVQAQPRAIRIAYFNPVHVQEFETATWLRPVGRDKSRLSSMVVTYWTNAPA